MARQKKRTKAVQPQHANTATATPADDAPSQDMDTNEDINGDDSDNRSSDHASQDTDNEVHDNGDSNEDDSAGNDSNDDNDDNDDNNDANNDDDNNDNDDNNHTEGDNTPATRDLIRFQDLNPPLSAATLSALSEQFNFSTCTPVQSATIPMFCAHKDVFVEACTGSGKTLAFLIPITEITLRTSPTLLEPTSTMDDISTTCPVVALIIAPTRELATQIHSVASTLFAHKNFHSRIRPCLVVGGTDVETEKRMWEDAALPTSRKNFHVKIVVGTPGRLEDMICKSLLIPCKSVESLVLDEADRLLDMGFSNSLNAILRMLPTQRRTGLFSATQTSELMDLVRAGLRNPVKVTVTVERTSKSTDQRTPSTLHNFFVICPLANKLSQLCHFLQTHAHKHKIMVYFLTCACVDYFSHVLPRVSVLNKVRPLCALHGQMVQKKRTAVYESFTKAKTGVLLCTDVAARGLDIPGVDLIVQFDAPVDPAVFIHRVGRTARMGRAGSAVVYLTRDEDAYVQFLENRRVPMLERPTYSNVANVTNEIQQMAANDRAIFELSQRAFVSFVRAYREHQCNYIFQMSKLDIGHLGQTFALVVLPKMPETNNKKLDFVPFDVDAKNIPYADKYREEQRKIREEKRKQLWEETAAEREQWKKKRKREVERLEKISDKRQKERKKMNSTVREWDDLANEMRLLKKLRKKKITKQDYERMTGETELVDALEKNKKGAKQNNKDSKKRKGDNGDDSDITLESSSEGEGDDTKNAKEATSKQKNNDFVSKARKLGIKIRSARDIVNRRRKAKRKAKRGA